MAVKKKNVSLKMGKHKSRSGGLTAAGRRKYNKATGSNLKAPQPGGGPRKRSFCARMSGVKGPMKKTKRQAYKKGSRPTQMEMLMAKKKKTTDDAFRSSTSHNGSVNDNESYVEKVFKLPYRIKEVYNTIKDKRQKEKEMYGDY